MDDVSLHTCLHMYNVHNYYGVVLTHATCNSNKYTSFIIFLISISNAYMSGMHLHLVYIAQQLYLCATCYMYSTGKGLALGTVQLKVATLGANTR